MKPLVILLGIALLTACGANSNTSRNASANAEVQKGVTPVADDEIAVIEMENSAAYGTIGIELYSNIAPKAVAQFKALASEGVYDGTTFHRINQSVIQAGDPNTKDADTTNDGQGKSSKPNVPAEFSDIPYDTGIVGAARSQDVNSANSQFFITLKRETGFDNRYTIFGKVIEGMNNVRTIAGLPATEKQGERPIEAIRIKTVRIEPKQ
jgi:peptidylprolyl isomerase